MTVHSELLYPYRSPQRIYLRAFANEEVRRIVASLCMIVRTQTFGYNVDAINVALLLQTSEPLEQLTVDDLATLKMRLYLLVYRNQYKEAQEMLNQVCKLYAEDSFLADIRAWIAIDRSKKHVR